MGGTIVAKATEREPSDRVSSFKKSLEELAEKVGVPRDRISFAKKLFLCRKNLRLALIDYSRKVEKPF